MTKVFTFIDSQVELKKKKKVKKKVTWSNEQNHIQIILSTFTCRKQTGSISFLSLSTTQGLDYIPPSNTDSYCCTLHCISSALAVVFGCACEAKFPDCPHYQPLRLSSEEYWKHLMKNTNCKTAGVLSPCSNVSLCAFLWFIAWGFLHLATALYPKTTLWCHAQYAWPPTDNYFLKVHSLVLLLIIWCHYNYSLVVCHLGGNM